MSVLFPLRIGHPQLFIPCEEFHNVHKKQMVVLRMFDSLDADIESPTAAKVRLPRWLSEYVPQVWAAHEGRMENR